MSAADRVIPFQWKADSSGWRLFVRKRCFGLVVPDKVHSGMWRVVLSGRRLSDLANLSWARHSLIEAACLEIEWEGRQLATGPRKCPVNGGVFQGISPPMSSNEGAATTLAAGLLKQKPPPWPPRHG